VGEVSGSVARCWEGKEFGIKKEEGWGIRNCDKQ
jgi:hypothetical protein